MRPLVILIAAVLTAVGLVGGAVAIGWSRLHADALPARAPAGPVASTPIQPRFASAPKLADPARTAPIPQNATNPQPAATKPAPPTSPPEPDPSGMQTDGSILLSPSSARIHGYRLKIQSTPRPVVSYWVDPQEYVEWPKGCPKAGQYEVEITYSCPPNAGGEFAVFAGPSNVKGRTENTGNWQTFRTVKLGTLAVINDNTAITVRPAGNINHALMDLRSVRLVPIASAP